MPASTTSPHTGIRHYLYKLTYAIAYPFWPKEMRQLIKKYKAEGTLNENWFLPYIRPVLVYAGLALSMLIAVIKNLEYTGKVIDYSIVAILMLWALRWQLKLSYSLNFKPYQSDVIKTLKVKRRKLFFTVLAKVYFVDPISNREYFSQYFGTLLKRRDIPQIGQEIECCVIETPRNIAMPNTHKFRNMYSLSNKKGL